MMGLREADEDDDLPRSEQEVDHAQYLTFGLAGEVFALSVHRVREVLDLPAMSRLAHAPPAFLGLIDVRGVGVPVVDLACKLALPASEATAKSRILVVEIEVGGRRLVIGALTDAVYAVTSLPNEAIEPPPDLGEHWDSAFMEGLGRHEGRLVTLLNIDRLFGASDAGLLEGGRF